MEIFRTQYTMVVGLINRIKKLLKWIPFLWNQNDTHYSYPLSLFKEQLINMANEFELNNMMYEYHRIETIINLMDKVYSYQYADEYIPTLVQPYGNFDRKIIVKNGISVIKLEWERHYTDSELSQLNTIHKAQFELSAEKQRRAHTLLWKLIEHNIQKWQM